jgi:hypothetical protein
VADIQFVDELLQLVIARTVITIHDLCHLSRCAVFMKFFVHI